MTGLEILRNPEATAEEITGIVSAQCPPIAPAECDRVSCRECWLAWLATGEPSSKEETPPLTQVEKKCQEPPEYRTARCIPDNYLTTNPVDIYMQTDRLLEGLIYQCEQESGIEPAAERARQRLIVYLMKLNRREEQLTMSPHRGELMELARLMETEYIEFRIKSFDKDLVTIVVFDVVRHQYVAELAFRKIFNSYGLVHYKTFSPARSDTPETPLGEART